LRLASKELAFAVCLVLGFHSLPIRWYTRKLGDQTADRFDVLTKLATLLEDAGDAEGAAKRFQEALVLKPQDSTPCWELGCLREEQGKIGEAIEWYEKALAAPLMAGESAYFRAALEERIKTLRARSS
jgi:tetratricopeptide (TPR) repeat protein